MNKTTVVVAAVAFALVGTMVFAAVAPYLSNEANATCSPNSPDGKDNVDDDAKKGCGSNEAKLKPCPPRKAC